MTMGKIYLFVEGSAASDRDRRNWLSEIWSTLIFKPVSGITLDHVYGISKSAIAAMDPKNAQLSGVGENIVQIITRTTNDLNETKAVIIGWDLVPYWLKNASADPLNEMRVLYSRLAQSDSLPDPFKSFCVKEAARIDQLGDKWRPPRALTTGSVLFFVMDPMFETLIAEEAIAAGALGVTGARPKGWPRNWGLSQKNPDRELIGAAVNSARRIRPKLPVFRKVRGDMTTAKNEWGYLLLDWRLNSGNHEAPLEHALLSDLAKISES